MPQGARVVQGVVSDYRRVRVEPGKARIAEDQGRGARVCATEMPGRVARHRRGGIQRRCLESLEAVKCRDEQSEIDRKVVHDRRLVEAADESSKPCCEGEVVKRRRAAFEQRVDHFFDKRRRTRRQIGALGVKFLAGLGDKGEGDEAPSAHSVSRNRRVLIDGPCIPAFP